MRIVRTHQNEEGAIFAIVALCLLTLIGMVVLVLDVGGLVTKRRGMVNAADAAALAAALSCAGEDGVPEEQADLLATANEAGAARTSFQIVEGTCPGPFGRLTLSYEAPQDLFFAPVLGFPDQMQVPAEADAMWGATGSGTNIVPIVINIGEDHGNCDVPDVPEGTRCNFWYNNRDLGNAQWGFLDLDHWDVDPTYNCPNAGAATRTDWIYNGYPEPRTVNYPDPTYVCTTNGDAESIWNGALEDQIGKTLTFPVNDPDGQLPAPPPETPTKYNIIGFTSLKLIDIVKGNNPAAVGSSDTSGGCSKKISFTVAPPGNVVNMDDLGCYVPPPTSVSGLQLAKTVAGVTTTFQEGIDYSYDAVTRTVTWTRGQDTANVNVDFTWFKSGTSGLCEPPERTPDPNAKCVITEWVGFSRNGLDPGGGAPLGVVAVRLDG